MVSLATTASHVPNGAMDHAIRQTENVQLALLVNKAFIAHKVVIHKLELE